MCVCEGVYVYSKGKKGSRHFHIYKNRREKQIILEHQRLNRALRLLHS